MRSLTGLHLEFFFSKTGRRTKAKEHSLSYYFTNNWKEGNWILSLLALNEIQTYSSSIWTLVAVSISSDGNHYTTNRLCWFISFL